MSNTPFLSFTDAAYSILERRKRPTHYQEITREALESGIIYTEGQTPANTMYAVILQENQRVTGRGETPRFVMHGNGLIGLTKWLPAESNESGSRKQKRTQFGEPIDFRGVRYAPINEQGVVHLFGLVGRDLGFVIESMRTEYPDCEGKRLVDPKRGRWEQVLIEFEFQSSNFKAHGHNPNDCDLIVCWIHDWQDCPLEVIELKSKIRELPNS